MSDLEIILRIQTALTTIRRHWSVLLDPPSSGAPGHGGSTLITADDHDEIEADIDRATRIVSLRGEIRDTLNAMSRWVMEERPVTKALPDGGSVLSMSLFLDRHAEWIAAWVGETGDDYEVERIELLANRARAMAAPMRRDWIHLGDCPFVYDVQEIHPGKWWANACHGQVRSRIGGDGTACCTHCGVEEEIAWWQQVLGIGWDLVTLPKLPAILRERLHISVTEQTLRNWRRDGVITPYPEPFGPAPQWDRYDPQVIIDQVSRLGKACVMCGQPWHGYADVCNRCYVTMGDRPQKARKPRPTPVASALYGWCPWPRYAAPPATRAQRCDYSDLPVDQCACGRHDVSA